MKCANCNKDAFYVYQINANSSVLYCNSHLPTFLTQAKKAGLLKTTDALKSAIEDGMKSITTPAEEPVLEMNRGPHGTMTETAPEVTEAPKPKKKATKKKAE